MNPKARRVLPRDAPSYFTWFFRKFSGLLEGYYTLVAYVLPLAHTRARGSVLSHSIGGRLAVAVNCDPPVVAVTRERVTLPMWRPARRLDARRYVKDQINLPITAPRIIPRSQITAAINFCLLVLATARITVLSVKSALK